MIYVISKDWLQLVRMARHLEFEDITFYNLPVYHYGLHDKQNDIITGETA